MEQEMTIMDEGKGLAVTRGAKRAAFSRILNDLLRFNEEQLKVLIDLAHRVRRSRHLLRTAAEEADRMMAQMPLGFKKDTQTEVDR